MDFCSCRPTRRTRYRLERYQAESSCSSPIYREYHEHLQSDNVANELSLIDHTNKENASERFSVFSRTMHAGDHRGMFSKLGECHRQSMFWVTFCQLRVFCSCEVIDCQQPYLSQEFKVQDSRISVRADLPVFTIQHLMRFECNAEVLLTMSSLASGSVDRSTAGGAVSRSRVLAATPGKTCPVRPLGGWGALRAAAQTRSSTVGGPLAAPPSTLGEAPGSGPW